MKYVIGIDEVGRGPIAGPVAVGAFVFLKINEAKKFFKGVKESKQLSEKEREIWFEKISKMREGDDRGNDLGLGSGKTRDYKNLADFAVTFQSEKVIDKKGLSFAIKKCLETSLEKLIKKHKIKPEEVLVLLDGGLKAPSKYIHQKTIIKGDTKEMAIALASICAKVLRDRKMVKWSKIYKEYGFEVNKGYGTKKHYEALSANGLTSIHRHSFLAKKPHIR